MQTQPVLPVVHLDVLRDLCQPCVLPVPLTWRHGAYVLDCGCFTWTLYIRPVWCMSRDTYPQAFRVVFKYSTCEIIYCSLLKKGFCMFNFFSITNDCSVICTCKVANATRFNIPTFFISAPSSLGNAAVYFICDADTWLTVICSSYTQTACTEHFHQRIVKQVEHDRGRRTALPEPPVGYKTGRNKTLKTNFGVSPIMSCL